MKALSAKSVSVDAFLGVDDVQTAFERFLPSYNSLVSQVTSALASNLTFSENHRARLKTVAITPRETLFEPTFTNGWKNYSAANGFGRVKYTKDSNGYVHLSGRASTGTVAANDTGAIFVLPAGYLPDTELTFPAASNDAFGVCRIGTGGQVKAWVGNNTYFSLDGISFQATDRRPIPNSIFPLDFQNGLPGGKAATGVVVVAVKDTETDARAVAGPIFCEWQNFKNQVRITSISGLIPNRRYLVTLLYFAE